MYIYICMFVCLYIFEYLFVHICMYVYTTGQLNEYIIINLCLPSTTPLRSNNLLRNMVY